MFKVKAEEAQSIRTLNLQQYTVTDFKLQDFTETVKSTVLLKRRMKQATSVAKEAEVLSHYNRRNALLASRSVSSPFLENQVSKQLSYSRT